MKAKRRLRACDNQKKRNFRGSSKPKEVPLLPPVEHLHTSNDPPTDEELQLLLVAIKTTREQLQVVNSERMKPQNNRISVSTKPESPQKVQLPHHIVPLESAVISSIRRLPTELLQAIFTMVYTHDP